MTIHSYILPVHMTYIHVCIIHTCEASCVHIHTYIIQYIHMYVVCTTHIMYVGTQMYVVYVPCVHIHDTYIHTCVVHECVHMTWMCTYEGQDQPVARVATNYTHDVCTSMMCTRTVCTEGSIPVPGNWYKVCMQPIQLYIHCHTVHVHIQYMNVCM